MKYACIFINKVGALVGRVKHHAEYFITIFPRHKVALSVRWRRNIANENK
jgi:hypothetical protein